MRLIAILLGLAAATAAQDVEAARKRLPRLDHGDAEKEPFVFEARTPIAGGTWIRVGMSSATEGTLLACSLFDGCPVLVCDGRRGLLYDLDAGKVLITEPASFKVSLGWQAGEFTAWFGIEPAKKAAVGIDLRSLADSLTTVDVVGEELFARSKAKGFLRIRGDRIIVLTAPGQNRQRVEIGVRRGEDAAKAARFLIPGFDRPDSPLAAEKVEPARVQERMQLAMWMLFALANEERRGGLEEVLQRKFDWTALQARHMKMSAALKNAFGSGPDLGGVERGYTIARGGDMPGAIAEWKLAAKAGDSRAAMQLAIRARDVDKDTKEALRWFRVAADREEPSAQVALAALLLDKTELRDPEAAERWLKRALWHDSPDALYWLGRLYTIVECDLTDEKKGMNLLRDAGNQGVVAAQGLFATLLASGRGLPKDLVEAWAWAAIAQEGGDQSIAGVKSRIWDGLNKEQREQATVRLQSLRATVVAK
ncbi:MAG: tetratricopeptide repeat protein [Planctomycetota bacterium]|jgi:TPR repeat protein